MKPLEQAVSRIKALEDIEKQKENVKSQASLLKERKDVEQEALDKRYQQLFSYCDMRLNNLNNASNAYCCTCKHELVLCLGKESALEKEKKYPFCVCLSCGRPFRLGHPDYEENINSESIIDVRDIIPEEDIITYRNSESILAIQARNKLKEIVEENPDITLEEAKSIILDDLINNRSLKRNRTRGGV